MAKYGYFLSSVLSFPTGPQKGWTLHTVPKVSLNGPGMLILNHILSGRISDFILLNLSATSAIADYTLLPDTFSSLSFQVTFFSWFSPFLWVLFPSHCWLMFLPLPTPSLLFFLEVLGWSLLSLHTLFCHCLIFFLMVLTTICALDSDLYLGLISTCLLTCLRTSQFNIPRTHVLSLPPSLCKPPRPYLSHTTRSLTTLCSQCLSNYPLSSLFSTVPDPYQSTGN